MTQIDLERHRELAASGLLYINEHPEADLLIHNYTPQVQFERKWTPETLMCRGLITDREGYIVARPFGKFFNLDEYLEHYGPVPAEPFEVFEKMDGSLGILYFNAEKPKIATRGSFSSEQALHANYLLQKKFGTAKFDPSITYLFEIIYPENRIVVDYGQQEELVLLGAIETRTGKELDLNDVQVPMPVVKRYDGIDDLDDLRAIQEDNREGFVIRFESGLRVKLKFEEYVRLHKVIAGISTRVIWENMMQGKRMEAILEAVPDEFYKWVKKVQTDLKSQFDAIEARAKQEFRVYPTRKAAAEAFLKSDVSSKILFSMLDGKPYDDLIWRMIRPEHQTPFMEES